MLETQAHRSQEKQASRLAGVVEIKLKQQAGTYKDELKWLKVYVP